MYGIEKDGVIEVKKFLPEMFPIKKTPDASGVYCFV